jgi:hypothetical protein
MEFRICNSNENDTYKVSNSKLRYHIGWMRSRLRVKATDEKKDRNQRTGGGTETVTGKREEGKGQIRKKGDILLEKDGPLVKNSFVVAGCRYGCLVQLK